MLLGVENPAEGAFPGVQVSQFHRLPTSRAYEFGLVEPLIRGMAVHGDLFLDRLVGTGSQVVPASR